MLRDSQLEGVRGNLTGIYSFVRR